MKQLLTLLLLFVFAAGTAQAQGKPKVKAKRAFAHTSESRKGKTDRTQFRRENKGAALIDLHPRSPERFKTAKANKNYVFRNPHK